MKLSLKLTFRDDEAWSTVQEGLRRLRKICLVPDGTDADHIAHLFREYLDGPATPEPRKETVMREPKVANKRYNPADISGGPDAANPTDDFDPDKNLRMVIALNAKVARLKERHEAAKNELKETDAYGVAKTLSEELKGATAELDELLAELGREYPLFRPNGAA